MSLQRGFMVTRKLLASVFAAVLMSFTAAAPAVAQPIVIVPGGLVNITIIDAVDLEQVNVQVPIGVAANVCDVTIAVLAEDVANNKATDCTARTTQDLPVAFR
jgi:hypothetical protein